MVALGSDEAVIITVFKINAVVLAYKKYIAERCNFHNRKYNFCREKIF